MAWRALGMTSVLVLAGCGSPWLGDETVVIAPTSVAEASLQATTPEETVVVAATTPQVLPTEQLGATSAAVGPANRGSIAVTPDYVAEAAMVAVSSGSANVAPVAPTGSTGLQPVTTQAAAPVPARPSGSDYVNPVEFALVTSHPVGQAVYPRAAASVDALACGGYRSGVAAQEAFLGAGGPQADPLGLDPDGDGYACDWDPAPYRSAARG